MKGVAWGKPSKVFIKKPDEESFTELRIESGSFSLDRPICERTIGEIPKIDAEIRYDNHVDIEAILNPSPEQQKKYEEVVNIMAQDIQAQLNEFYQKCIIIAEEIMRTVVTPPIKGKVTFGKIRYRGLRVCFGHDEEGIVFYGVLQRGKILYTPGGSKWAVVNNTIVGLIE